ncbi:transposase [Parashewanella spongiae]|uniref:Transposase n=1 Tax=Parashewanella spongiae TaxID=342950 RepID=A0A3A6TL45_9GAMM|nr:transposase [Parashewanella spongiae]RJY11128.1 transposase [Parashewanella spongiae]
MSRFEKLSHVLWHCQYHIVWVPKYRFRILKGRTAIRIFKQFPHIRKKPYWGNHFWAKGYCVDTVGIDAEMIRKYVKYQEKLEKRQERFDF